MSSDLAKKWLYGSGLLGLYHRLRNRRTLTVIMFHRVLERTDPRWRSCDPDYTLEADLLDACLAFFRRHYRIVSAEDVLAARRGGRPLPPHALLITFDDGWSDNHDYALPRLARAGVPGLLFVVADVIGRRLAFYQERIVGGWRLGRLRVADLAAAAGCAAADESIDSLRRVIAAIERLDETERARVLAPFADALDDGLRHMVSADEVAALERGGIAIGTHGKTHTPMPRATDLAAELGGARREVAVHLEGGRAPATMSFPHGRYDAAIAERAHEAGFELVFTSDPTINPIGDRPDWLLGRLGFEQSGIVDRAGRFRPDKLALHLFRRPIRAPAAG